MESFNELFTYGGRKKISILDLAYNYDLDFFDLYNYLLKWRNKKLLKFKKIKY